MRICDVLAVPRGITAVVGGGGKTSLIWRLATELCQTERVLLTTTTHMMPPPCPTLDTPVPAQITIAFQENRLLAVGALQADGKLAEARALRSHYENLAAYVLIEADGSRGLPLKAPADHEPVIPAETALTIAVAGMGCAGRRIGEVTHRAARYASLLGVTEDDLVTPNRVAAMLMHPQGQRKDAAGRYAVVLNQADTPERLAFARSVAALLPMDVLITALQTRPWWQEHWVGGASVQASG